MWATNKALIKKVAGISLVLLGLLALLTPFTPGSWLALIGLELLGVRALFLEKIWRYYKRDRMK